MKVVIVLAGIADWLVAALLIAVSGFVFGNGPESVHGGLPAAAGWVAMIIVCLAAPVVGFVLARKGRAGLGLLVAASPVTVALLIAVVPYHPY